MDEAAEQIPLVNQCPECSHSLDVASLQPFAKIECPHCRAHVRVRTVMGQYHITQILGEGGMSRVFRAVDMNLGREVALKVLHQSLSRDKALTAMFEREAKLTASILHPNVVKVYTVGKQQGYFFIAMELVDATSLEELIAEKGALPEQDVLDIAHDVTRGLKAAFHEDLIHRDIKPGNMLVTDAGMSKLVDFGLAVHQGGADESEDLWATPFYVPPEKLDGHPDTYLGDIYSLGATLFHALAGQPPFDANTSSLEELKLIKQKDIDLKSRAPGTSKGTVRLIAQMMAYRPEDRIDSYDEILNRIEDIQKRQFGIKRGGRLPKGSTKRRGVIVGGAALIVAAILGAAAYFSGGPSDEDFGLGLERVISAEENINAEKFLRGRGLFADGEFGKASKLFEDLAREDSLSPLTRKWNNFFLGASRLFLGDDLGAREAFRAIEEVEVEKNSEPSEALRFLGLASEHFSDPLPVVGAEAAFAGNPIEPLGLLVSGLKNWQDGQFESGVRLMKAFRDSDIPPEYSWLDRLKKSVGPFFSDFAVLEQLPNPSRSESDMPLPEQEKTLEAAGRTLKTRGALPDLVNSRIERIALIRQRIAEEEARRQAAEIARDEAAAAEPPEPGAGPSNGTAPTPEEESEKARLEAIVQSLPDRGEALSFDDLAARIEAEKFETATAERMQEDLLGAVSRAETFVGFLSRELSAGEYEGLVRRREGIPIEARVTAADSETFVLDLGFGPNEVAVEEFAPDWLVEVAGEIFPPPTERNAERWESLVYFAFFAGLTEESERFASLVGPVSPAAEERWERLAALR
ncbi:MAG: serine/threonine-protein kinase [Verrucomicrobiales bacterium]